MDQTRSAYFKSYHIAFHREMSEAGRSPTSPLSDEEIRKCSGLLQRAMNCSQIFQVRDVMVQNASYESGFIDGQVFDRVIGQVVEIGAMSDAAKRQRDEDSEHDTDGWRRVKETPSSHVQENEAIPLPDGCETAAVWGKTVCAMEKYRQRKWTYQKMVDVADGKYVESGQMSEMRDYFAFLMARYSTKGGKSIPQRITPAIDLCMYLERIKWDGAKTPKDGVKSGSSKDYAFKREFKS